MFPGHLCFGIWSVTASAETVELSCVTFHKVNMLCVGLTGLGFELGTFQSPLHQQ